MSHDRGHGDSGGHGGLRELRQNASELVRRVEAGGEVTITVAGRPSARLVPIDGPAGGGHTTTSRTSSTARPTPSGLATAI